MDHIAETLKAKSIARTVPTVSAVLADGSIVEMIYRPEEGKTLFVVGKHGEWSVQESVPLDAAHVAVPYSPRNDLVRNQIVLFPSEAVEYGAEAQLLQDIRDYIHRYVHVGLFFEKLASYYVLFSWVHDHFNELPYLRIRGEPGCGKTRFLLIVGSICYKPIFASGASTVSPIFRMLDSLKGTLVIDESDFRMSDEKAEIVKIFNNGNVRGFPVLRSEQRKTGEFSPRAYQVFGPKIVATRGSFEDKALESRFITEEMGQTDLREDIPINLPNEQKQEALELRNKLLVFRMRNLHRHTSIPKSLERQIEPRLSQILSPLLTVIDDPGMRQELETMAQSLGREMVIARGMDTEARVLQVIQGLLAQQENSRLSVGEITSRFNELYGEEYEKKITSRWIGWVLHERLHLKTQKSQGVFVLSVAELPKLQVLYKRYGLLADSGSRE